MNRVCIGYDYRQPVSYHVLSQSILSHSTTPVSIAPLVIEQLPLKRQGLTPFTYSRFLVPWLCHYDGWALFLDADILVLGDITDLFALADDRYSIMVVKHPARRFEWASVMLMNCARLRVLTPEYIETAAKLHTIGFVPPEEIGALPPQWNHLVGYDKPLFDAKLVHFTMGLPIYDETKDSPYALEWKVHLQWVTHAQPWAVLMGDSVHTTVKDGNKVANLEAWKNVN